MPALYPRRLRLPTPLGVSLDIQADERGITASRFVRAVPQRRARTPDPLLREAAIQIRAYFAKRLRRFDLTLHIEGTAFQKRVWNLVAQLETGEIISYGDLARAVGAPRAARGVAAAMARTPFDLLIPAHRVVGSDGSVRGAGAGSMRRRLLRFEGITLR